MKARSVLSIAIAVCLAGAWAGADDKKGDKPKVAKPTAAELFAKFKSLAGDWTGKASHDGHEMDATVSYKVTSHGSTVMETLFGGTEHEMITMYHLDGDSLVLTHYCSLGNQPRLKAKEADKENQVAFDFLDGANIDPAKDEHMHAVVFEFVGDDHLKADWTSYSEGKPKLTAKFDLKRKQAKGK